MFISKWFRLVHEVTIACTVHECGIYWSMSANVRLFRISPPPTACESLRFTFNWILIHISEHIIRIVKSTQFTISSVDDYDDEANDSDDNLNHDSTTYCDALNQFHCSLR